MAYLNIISENIKFEFPVFSWLADWVMAWETLCCPPFLALKYLLPFTFINLDYSVFT